MHGSFKHHLSLQDDDQFVHAKTMLDWEHLQV
jgi:hypothetical protein